MIVRTSIKGNGTKCDCCNKRFSDGIMMHYEIGEIKDITLCKECEKQLFNVSKVDTSKMVISVDNNIFY